uniref:Uncharacterized protein n=1 Tax=Globisporangium ultimum (strain ATCC 200006 / CBS 805.95 / DAOM BR144) TaxID=431595 RepID=K3WKB6_GLOUD
MRVLLVNAYPVGSARACERFDKFRHHVQRVIKELEKNEVTQVELVERTRNKLDEFLFEMHSEFANPQMITNFDLLDFVLVDGDANALPWAPAMRKLALLTKMCMMTGKCLFASGIGAGLLAFVCATGGEHLHVLNNDGKGSLIEDIGQIPALPPRSMTQTLPRTAGTEVLLDTKTGDFFAFNYGATINAARAGSKPHRGVQHPLSHPLYLSKRGETKCCVRLAAATHALFTGVPKREFIANCKSKWNLDEEIASTGTNKYRVLVDSARGPMLVEFGNCVGTHFGLFSSEHAETSKLLRNFVLAKYEELKVHAHIDRSYVLAISGSSRLKDLLLAQARSIHTSSASSSNVSKHGVAASSTSAGSHSHIANAPPMMTPGRTSPKRCRPVSAGPSRTASKVTQAIRTIKTSRSVNPSSTASSGPDQLLSNNNSKGDSNRRMTESREPERTIGATTKVAFGSYGPEEPVDSDERKRGAEEVVIGNQSDEVRSKPNANVAHRRVRVPQKNELEQPYCAIHKFTRMRLEEKAQQHQSSSEYYSVINDAPYVSAMERELVETQRSKLKWVAGPFRTAIGKATTNNPAPPEPGVFASAPFIQKNTPFYIIQRRVLEEEAHEPRASKQPTKMRPSFKAMQLE